MPLDRFHNTHAALESDTETDTDFHHVSPLSKQASVIHLQHTRCTRALRAYPASTAAPRKLPAFPTRILSFEGSSLSSSSFPRLLNWALYQLAADCLLNKQALTTVSFSQIKHFFLCDQTLLLPLNDTALGNQASLVNKI